MTRVPSPTKTQAMLLLLLLLLLLLVCGQVHAATPLDAVGEMARRFDAQEHGWAQAITDHASWLFWTLSTISLVWTFAFLLLRRADFGEIFIELIRFITFTGLFWWILTNAVSYDGGDGFITRIVDSLKVIGSDAMGGSTGLSPGSIATVGIDIFEAVIRSPDVEIGPDKLVVPVFMLAILILVVLTLAGINVMLVLVSAWTLAYGGIFLLGFGGMRWTSTIAINYYKQVLAVALSYLAMIIVVHIGKTFLLDYMDTYGETVTLNNLAVMLAVSLVLLGLVIKIPSLLSGIVTGSSLSAASSAAGMTVNAFAASGAAIAAGATAAASNAQSLMTAYQKASEYAADSHVSHSVAHHGFYGPTEQRNDSQASHLSATSVFDSAAGSTPPQTINLGGMQANAGVPAQSGLQASMAAGSGQSNAGLDRFVVVGGVAAESQNAATGSQPTPSSAGATNKLEERLSGMRGMDGSMDTSHMMRTLSDTANGSGSGPVAGEVAAAARNVDLGQTSVPNVGQMSAQNVGHDSMAVNVAASVKAESGADMASSNVALVADSSDIARSLEQSVPSADSLVTAESDADMASSNVTMVAGGSDVARSLEQSVPPADPLGDRGAMAIDSGSEIRSGIVQVVNAGDMSTTSDGEGSNPAEVKTSREVLIDREREVAAFRDRENQ